MRAAPGLEEIICAAILSFEAVYTKLFIKNYVKKEIEIS